MTQLPGTASTPVVQRAKDGHDGHPSDLAVPAPSPAPNASREISVTLPAGDLLRVLYNAQLFTAGKNDARVPLRGVMLELNPNSLHAVGTDGYAIAMDFAQADLTAPQRDWCWGAFLLAQEDCKTLVRAFDALGRGDLSTASVNVALRPDAHAGMSLHVEGCGDSWSFAPLSPEPWSGFPDWRALMHRQMSTSVTRLAFNPAYLRKFATVRPVGDGAMRVTFTGAFPTSPILVNIGETFAGAVMPVAAEGWSK